MLDILQFVALADQNVGLPFARQTHSLSGAFDIITPVDPVTGYGQWKHVKHVQGWPWDIKLYDAQYVYDWITEKDWESGPRAYKKFIRNHPVSSRQQFEDGLVQLPRFISLGGVNFDQAVDSSLTQYATFVDCKQVSSPQSLGIIHQRVRGPFTIDHGGDVGPQLTLIHQYSWMDGTTPVMEENYFALNYGWVRWVLLHQDVTGMYRPVNTTVSNKLAPGKPIINFPCF